jgi:hypothetical protein
MNKSIYEVIAADEATLTPERIKRTDTNGVIWWIPVDSANSDYQTYLKSLDEAKAK